MNFSGLQGLLDTILHAERFVTTGDPNGAFRPPARPDTEIRRLGLALEPGPGWRAWAEREKCDAVFLHRPWGVDHALADAGVGVLAYHLGFDECLTTGFNPTLAAACDWGEPALFAEKQGRPLGMICSLPSGAVPFWKVLQRLEAEFGRMEGLTKPAAGIDDPVGGLVCVGAMNDALVREAHAAGAGVYVTGQWREPARKAVAETGIGVIAIGHRRSEEWGLRTLANLLRDDRGTVGMEVGVFFGQAT